MDAVDRWSVARWMSKDPWTAGPGDPIVDALDLMQQHRIRHVPIVAGDRLAGTVSARDVRRLLPLEKHARLTAEAATDLLFSTPIRAVMAAKPFTVTIAAALREAAELLCREKISALPVMEQGRLVGIITSEDMLWAFLENTRDAEFSGD